MKTKTKEKTEITLEDKKCTTPKFRVSFPNVFEPKSFENGPLKYSITMLFDKDTDLTALKKAAHNAKLEAWGPKEKWPKNLRSPFRDGNEKENLQGYQDCIFVSASSKQRPGVIDKNKEPITAEDETFYAGCYARATLIAFAYDTAGNKGVSFALQNIQKLADGEQFSGKKSAADDFDVVEDASDDKESYEDDSEDDEDFS